MDEQDWFSAYGQEREKRQELEAKVERQREALQAVVDHIIPRNNDESYAYNKVLAALEGKQEKERCPHLAGDLCVKEGACECYGG